VEPQRVQPRSPRPNQKPDELPPQAAHRSEHEEQHDEEEAQDVEPSAGWRSRTPRRIKCDGRCDP